MYNKPETNECSQYNRDATLRPLATSIHDVGTCTAVLQYTTHRRTDSWISDLLVSVYFVARV